MTIAATAIADLVADDMTRMDAWISAQLQSDVSLIEQVGQYILQAGGKRLRPTLLLLMCQALACDSAQRHNLAAVIEFIHTATLLHDDVVDESDLRRGKPTANAAFGNAASVLVGDFLYSRAFQMMVQTGDMRVMQVLADATNRIAEGEVLQLLHTRNADLTLEQYYVVIHRKTARLFEASCELAALLAGVDANMLAACAGFGRHIGMAFQMVDDVLDYTGSTTTLGKNLGDDLREGKMTLPLIIALQKATPADQAAIRRIVETNWHANADAEAHLAQALTTVQHVLASTDALPASAALARQEAERAAACLENWEPQGQTAVIARQALQQMALSLLARQT